MAESYKLALNPGSTVTAHSNTTASTQADRGKDNLVIYDKPLRVYESNSTASTTATVILLDYGADATPDQMTGALLIDNVNFDNAKITIESGGNTSTTTGQTVSAAPVLDKRTGRYKLLYTPTGENHRYWKITVASGATLGGVDVGNVQVGSIVLMQKWIAGSSGADALYQDFPAGNYPLSYTIQSPQIVNKFPGGATESISIGERFVSFATPNIDYIRGTQEDTILDILQNELNPIVFYENDGGTGSTGRAYVCKLVSAKPVKVTYKTQSTTQMSFSFTECI